MSVVADELLLVVKSNVTQALAGLEAVDRKTTGLGSNAAAAAAKYGKAAILGVGMAAGAIGVASSKMAMDFEESMAQIEALVGVPKDEMKELETAALDMGKKFGVSAQDAAGGLFFLKSAGLETSEAIATLESTAMASAMGLGDMESLANTATTAMTNFGLDSTEAFDSIAMAAKLAKADPAALGKIMNENSAAASLVGMEYGDMAGTLALLTRKFGDANKAGTGMNGILNKLVKPSEMAKGMLDEIGVSAMDFQKMLAEDLPGGLAELDKAFAENGISQTEWLGKVFEDGEAIKAAAAVIGTSGAEIEDVFGGMGEAQGTLAQGWGVMEETAAVKWSKMKESIKSSLIPIGAAILDVAIPALEMLVEWIGRGVEWFSNLVSGSKEVTGAFGTIVDAIKGIISYFQFIFEEGDELNDFLTHIPEGFRPVVQAIGELVVFFQDNWSQIVATVKMAFDEIWAYLGPVIESMVDLFKTTIGGLVTWWDDNFETFKEVFFVILGLIQRHWERVWNAVKDHIAPIWEAIKTIITGVINVIKGIIQTVMAVITGDWERAWEGIKMTLEGLLDIIVGLITGAWELIQTAWDLGLAMLGTAWDIFWSTLGNGVQAAWDGVVSIVKGAINGIISFLQEKINAAISLVNGAIDAYNSIPLAPNIGRVGAVSIPRLADGGTVMRSGTTLVGENGPELLHLNRGAQVQPLQGPNSGGGPQTIIVQVGDEEFARFVLDKAGLSNMRQARRTA